MLASLSLVGPGTTTPRHKDRSKQVASNELTNDEEAFAKGKLPPTLCTRVRIDVSAVLESNLQPNFHDDRDVCEWLYRAACRLKRGQELNPCIVTVDGKIGAESFARFER